MLRIILVRRTVSGLEVRSEYDINAENSAYRFSVFVDDRFFTDILSGLEDVFEITEGMILHSVEMQPILHIAANWVLAIEKRETSRTEESRKRI
jgi:hypothetical protein